MTTVAASGDLLLYVRETAGERILVALNLGGEPTAVSFPSGPLAGRVLVSAFGDRDGQTIETSVDLRGDEGLVILLAPGSVSA